MLGVGLPLPRIAIEPNAVLRPARNRDLASPGRSTDGESCRCKQNAVPRRTGHAPQVARAKNHAFSCRRRVNFGVPSGARKAVERFSCGDIRKVGSGRCAMVRRRTEMEESLGGRTKRLCRYVVNGRTGNRNRYAGGS